MGHSIRGVGLPEVDRGPPKSVAVVPLDKTLASLPNQAERRIVLKIDAEGFEPNVIVGANASTTWQEAIHEAGSRLRVRHRQTVKHTSTVESHHEHDGRSAPMDRRKLLLTTAGRI